MRNKKVIFIDLDGTILDVSERIYKVYKDILKKYHKKFLQKKNYINLKRKKTPWKEILKKTKAEDISLEFQKDWEKEIENYRYLELDKISYSNRKRLLGFKNHYKLVSITLRNHPERLFKQLKKKKIDKIFDRVLVTPGGSSPNKWRSKVKLIKKYKNFNKNSVIVGDTETDILTGKHFKFKTVAVTSGMRNRAILEKCQPDILIKNIASLKQCNF